jgi:PAS domain S-box-containing protein
MNDQRKTKAQLIAELSAERQRRVELETIQRRNEQRFRRLVDRAPDIIFYLNLQPSPHFDYLSPSIEEITGYPPARFYADPAFALSLVHPEDRHLLLAPTSASLLPDEPIVYRLNALTGKEVWLEQRHVVVKDDHEEPVAVEGIARDRTEQVLSRAALQQSLLEKELLLKEIHHRVKNNLTLVGSLLELQAVKSDDERLREMLAVSQKRLLSVARIHEALYLSEDLGQIDLKSYIMRLGNDFAEALDSDCRSIRYDLEEVTMALRDAVQFGLILNELVSNAFKHAFPTEFPAEPSIEIRLRTSPAEIRTTISDNGVGLPADFNLHENQSLGLQIVRLLTEQLGGTLEYSSTSGSGTTFTVRVPADPGGGAGTALNNGPTNKEKEPSR